MIIKLTVRVERKSTENTVILSSTRVPWRKLAVSGGLFSAQNYSSHNGREESKKQGMRMFWLAPLQSPWSTSFFFLCDQFLGITFSSHFHNFPRRPLRSEHYKFANETTDDVKSTSTTRPKVYLKTCDKSNMIKWKWIRSLTFFFCLFLAKMVHKSIFDVWD